MNTPLDKIIFFPKSLNFSRVIAKSSKGGSVTWLDTDCSVNLTTSTSADSISSVVGYLPLYLNHEMNVKVSLNAAFASPKEGLVQLLGMGDSEAGVFVGYNGLHFGLHLRTLGVRRNWEVLMQGTCTTTGTVTLTLLNVAHKINVTAGQNAMSVMYAITQSTSIRNENIESHVCCDRMYLYTTEARDWAADLTPSFDAGVTGLTGSCTRTVNGAAPTQYWVVRGDFNAATHFLMQDIDLSVMNVYQFTFCRWSSGTMNLSMLNPSTGQITSLHDWNPPGSGFNTSITYTPFVYIKNATEQNGPSTLSTSMASISSGTPETASNATLYRTTFTATSISVVAGSNRVVGLLTVPNLVQNKRNHMSASIEEIRVNAKTPRAVRVQVHVNAQIDSQSPVNLHLPWSCVRHGMPQQPTKVSGGLRFASMYVRDTIPSQTETFDQLWLVGGTSLTISATAVTDPVTLSLDVDVLWREY
jgi:hypothetical protein